MLTILLNVILGALCAAALKATDTAALGWAIFWGILIAIAGQVGAGLLLRKRMQSVMDEVQMILKNGQARMQQKINRWQQKPPSGMKQAQDEIMKDQRAMTAEALACVEQLTPFYKWIPMLHRQVETMRLQFAWQLKDLKLADELLPRAVMMDPMLMCIKLARMYQLEKPVAEMEKVFNKNKKRLRYNQSALLYATWAWILLQKKDVDAAFKVLNEANEKNENEILKRNREAIANNKPAHFTNAGFGDTWYALFLEEPKMRQQRQQAGSRFF